jgi:hypothetical protein
MNGTGLGFREHTGELRVNFLQGGARWFAAPQLHHIFHDSGKITGQSACSFVSLFVIAELGVVGAALGKLTETGWREGSEE